jgi:polyphenol oxidase
MIYQFRNLKSFDGLIHGVTTTRYNDISNFNLADHVGLNAEDALEQRRKICGHLGLDFNRLTVGRQVHQPNVTLVTEELAGQGHLGWNTGIPDTDALVTHLPATPLMVLSADCPLILVYDPKQMKKALAVIHASWRCTFSGIITRTLDLMIRTFGCDPGECFAGIGPGAGPCCYQVDEKFVQTIGARPELLEHVIERNNERFFDLWSAAKAELVRAGLRAGNIDAMNKCTICDESFFSFRRQGELAGRFGLIAALKK